MLWLDLFFLISFFNEVSNFLLQTYLYLYKRQPIYMSCILSSKLHQLGMSLSHNTPLPLLAQVTIIIVVIVVAVVAIDDVLMLDKSTTVEPILKNYPIGHKNMVSQDKWFLVTGSFTLKCRTFCQELVVLQDRWSLMAVVSQNRFHCMCLCVLLLELYMHAGLLLLSLLILFYIGKL